MNDTVALFALLAGLYLAECLLRLPASGTIFASRTGNRFHWCARSEGAARQAGWFLAPPFPPLGTVLPCRALSPLVSSPDQPPDVDATEGSGDPIRRTIDASLDEAAIRARLEAHRTESQGLRWLANLLFVHLFVFAPVAAWSRGMVAIWPALLFPSLMLVGALGFEFRRAHSRLFPDDSFERRSRLSMILLSPLAAVRAGDALSRDLLAGFHPLAVGAVLGPRDAVADDARRTLHDLAAREGAEGATGPASRLRRSLERMLTRAGWPPAVLARPPEPAPGGRSFCPRCHEQYRLDAGECADCPGVALRG